MSQQLTIICPSYNRSYFLKRSIRFWSETNYKVLIADGSDVKNDDFKSHNNVSYFYLKKDLTERILFLLDKIETPYSTLVGDDEVYLPQSLDQCINFLNKNSDYSSAIGRAIGYGKFNKKLYFCNVYPEFRGRHNTNDSPTERLKYHFKFYAQTHLYSVIRTNVFKEAMLHSMKMEFDLFGIWELITEFIVLTYGKSIVLPITHWLRCLEAAPIRDTKDLGINTRDVTKRFEVWWNNPNNKVDKERFCLKLSEITKKIISVEDVQIIFNNYCANKFFNKYYIALRNSTPYKIRSLYSSYKVFRRNFLWYLSKNTKSNSKVLNSLQNQGVEIDKKSLKIFKDIIETNQ